MLDKEKAQTIARSYLERLSAESHRDFVLFEDKTLELEFGWVFFYSTRQHVETGDFRYMVPGNAPIIVDKTDGSIHPTGTSEGVQYHIEQYRKKHRSSSE